MKRLALLLALTAIAPLARAANAPSWSPVETVGKLNARHEAAFIAVDKKIYPLGGRRIQPAEIFDPATST